MNKISWIIVFLLTLSLASAGQRILEVDLTFNNEDKMLSSDVKLSLGTPSIEYNETGDYVLQILDVTDDVIYSNTYDINFLILATTGKIGDKTTINSKIKYNEDMFELRLYHKGRIIYQKFLDFCDKNFICDHNENVLACPHDCLPDERDALCIKDDDGVCDPDCIEGVDPDCRTKEAFNKVLTAFLVVLLLILILAVVHERKKFRKIPDFIRNHRYYKIVIIKLQALRQRFLKAIESFK